MLQIDVESLAVGVWEEHISNASWHLSSLRRNLSSAILQLLDTSVLLWWSKQKQIPESAGSGRDELCASAESDYWMPDKWSYCSCKGYSQASSIGLPTPGSCRPTGLYFSCSFPCLQIEAFSKILRKCKEDTGQKPSQEMCTLVCRYSC